MFSIFNFHPYCSLAIVFSLVLFALVDFYPHSLLLINESAEEHDCRNTSLINYIYLEVCFYFQYLGYRFWFQMGFLAPDVISGDLLCGFLRTHLLLTQVFPWRYIPLNNQIMIRRPPCWEWWPRITQHLAVGAALEFLSRPPTPPSHPAFLGPCPSEPEHMILFQNFCVHVCPISFTWWVCTQDQVVPLLFSLSWLTFLLSFLGRSKSPCIYL